MKKLTIKNIIDDCQGQLIKGNLKIELDNFSIDTRTIQQGDVFIGLKGEKKDGGEFFEEALKKGAKGCILNKNVAVKEDILNKYPLSFIVLVDDTLKTLQTLAKIKRTWYKIPVIAITGSVGKTSTKDLVATILAQKYNVLKTEGNFNNYIGLPLTILRLQDHNCLVVEMGMNSLGEISLLSHIAKPTMGIITNIGTAHIGLLGSRENILKAKLEILDGMEEKNLIINLDNDLLEKWYLENKEPINVITYGILKKAQYTASHIKLSSLSSEFKVAFKESVETFKVNYPGEHFIYNSLAGIAVGCYFNLSFKQIKQGLLNYELTKNRMEIVKVNNITVINDSYNASFDSVVSVLNYLGTYQKRKIAILGNILELGDFSEQIHRNLGEYILKNKIDILITVGSYARYINEECLKKGFNKNNSFAYNSNEEAILKIKEIKKEDDIILIKASNGMKFNEIFQALKEDKK